MCNTFQFRPSFHLWIIIHHQSSIHQFTLFCCGSQKIRPNTQLTQPSPNWVRQTWHPVLEALGPVDPGPSLLCDSITVTLSRGTWGKNPDSKHHKNNQATSKVVQTSTKKKTKQVPNITHMKKRHSGEVSKQYDRCFMGKCSSNSLEYHLWCPAYPRISRTSKKWWSCDLIIFHKKRCFKWNRLGIHLSTIYSAKVT